MTEWRADELPAGATVTFEKSPNDGTAQIRGQASDNAVVAPRAVARAHHPGVVYCPHEALLP